MKLLTPKRIVKTLFICVILAPLGIMLFGVSRQLVRSNPSYSPVTDFLPDSPLLSPVLLLSGLGFVALWVIFLSVNDRLRADGLCARTFPRYFGYQLIVFVCVCPAMFAGMCIVWSWVLEFLFHGIGSPYVPHQIDPEILSKTLVLCAWFTLVIVAVVSFMQKIGRADPVALYYGGSAALRASIRDGGQTWILHVSNGSDPAKGLGSTHLRLFDSLMRELHRLGPQGPKRIIMDSHLLANNLSEKVAERFERFLAERRFSIESKSTERLTSFQTWVRSKKDSRLKEKLRNKEGVDSSCWVLVSGYR